MSEAGPGIAKIIVALSAWAMILLLIIIVVSAVLGWGCIEGSKHIYKTYKIKVEKETRGECF